MGFLSTFLGIIGCGIGFPIGLFIGFYFFIYSMPQETEDPKMRPLFELESDILQDLIPEIPLWVKNPDYDRVDWLNQFILEMWPFLDKAVCSIIRSTFEPMFADYIGKYMVEKIEFENLTLGTLPPTIQGLKVYETNEKELVLEPSIKWAGNANAVVSIVLLSARIRLQLVDLQFFALPRVTLKPLVPTFPCFTNIVVSLMEKPHVDFGFRVLGGDFMAIPGLYRFVQETIKKQVTKLYHWPQTLEIPVLSPTSVTMKKPVGILHVKVVRAAKLLKRDLLGLSDPYVKIRLSGDRFPAKKTSIKKKTLNPEWNETFKLTVRDPQTQLLSLDVFDWDKVGGHDKLGKQVFPLKNLKPNETKEVTLDLLKSTDLDNDLDMKKMQQQRGQVVVELTYAPFREGSEGFSGHFGSFNGEGSSNGDVNSSSTRSVGLLLVTIIGAQDVEGSRHNNPYVEIFFRGEKRKSKVMRKTRDPRWEEDFQFMVEEPPMNEKIHLQVMSKKKVFGFRFFKEALGNVDINLDDVIHNGRINEKYHLIDSKNGIMHVELGWKTI